MIVQILLPHLDSGLESGKIAKWHVREGSRVVFGEPICDVAVGERTRLRPSGGGDRLLKMARFRGPRVQETKTDTEGFTAFYRVLASEPVVVTTLALREGDSVMIGALLGTAATEQDPGPSEQAQSQVLAMRVVAIPIQEDEQ